MLTAGAIGTPTLLMLSGIGPASALRPHDIKVIAELPGVGQNLHDHPYAFIVYRPVQPLPAAANNHGEALGLLCSEPDLGYPNLQIIFVDISLVPPSMGGPESGYTIAPALMQPFSRGTVQLASGNPDAAPVVAPRYLSDPRDVQTMVTGLKIAREIGQATALAPWRAEEALPGPGTDTDEALMRRLGRSSTTDTEVTHNSRLGHP